MGAAGALAGGMRARDGRHRQVGARGHLHAPGGLLFPAHRLSFPESMPLHCPEPAGRLHPGPLG